MQNLPYHIERTRNRTSSASITNDGVLIRLAGRLSTEEERLHIQVLLKRMAKRYTEYRSAPRIDPFDPLLRGNGTFSVTLADGTDRTFTVTAGSRTSAKMMGETWMVRRSLSMEDGDFRKFLWRLLSVSGQPKMEALVRKINARTFQATVTAVRLRHMQSRFGSCSRGGRITLNTALLFVSEKLCTSVIIHELAHILHPNHSSTFWDSVKDAMPEYEEYRKALRAYRLCGG